MTEAVAVFGSSRSPVDGPDWSDAYRVGQRLATAGLAVITGGYGGTMEAVSQGAAEAGGHVIGVTLPNLFPDRSGANPYVAELIETSTLAGRIDVMMALATATITLPGSIGTATELLVAWNSNFIAALSGQPAVPAVAVGEPWRRFADTVPLELASAIECVRWAETADEAVDWVLGILELPGTGSPISLWPE